ncbi:MAG: CorA family divalent cation transporter [Oscillospiraceae bacterium]|nr:CorA family divalent cation transporter [Oscillospiraceae bacterium]
MQKVIYINEIQNYSEYIDQSVIDYIRDGQIETYESFGKYDLIAFDWFDLENTNVDPAQILIYLDRDDLFYCCENDDSLRIAQKLFASHQSNEHALYLFFRNLFKGSAKHVEQLEDRVSDLDDNVTDGTEEGLRENLISMRNEILRVKKYYEQLEFLFEEICDNDNDLISEDGLKYFEVLHNRSVRLVSQSMNLREYLTQVRESYQSQIGIEQNNLMKVFTMVTSIFLPLTLIAGWYGMNVRMPEFNWKYGYLFVVLLCVAVSVVWLIVFRKKKWL